MMQIFLYNNSTGSLELNLHEILLVKEFEAIWDLDRNKCEEDPKGTKRLKAWKEFKYIWLFADWKSPYQQYLEHEKHHACMEDSGLTEEEWNDPVFRAAMRKYIDIIGSSRVLKLIKTAFRTLEKMRVSLDNIDIDERDPVTNKPIFKPKEILESIASIGTMANKLKELEIDYTKELTSSNSKLRGDIQPGFMDE